MTDDSFQTCVYNAKGTADTAGWDTVYAVRVPVINKALSEYFKSGSNLLDFDVSMDDVGASMRGILGAWQITTGGSGPNIMLTMPIVSGTATIPGQGNPVNLDGASLKVQVALGFHPVPDGQANGKTRAALKVNTSGTAPAKTGASGLNEGSATETGSPTAPQASVNVLAASIPAQAALSSGAATLDTVYIETLFKTWLEKHIDIFDFVLLTVDIAEHANQDKFSWITPTYVGYAVTDLLNADGSTSGIENSIFAFLAMTQGNEPAGVSLTVSGNAIPDNPEVNAAFLIAPHLIISKILLPNIPSLFGSSSDNDFAVSPNGMSISNRVPLSMNLELEDTWYVGKNPAAATIPAGDFNITVEDSQIRQQFLNLSFLYGHDDDVTVQVTLISTSTLGLDSGKHFAMKYGQTNTSSISVQPDAKKVASAALWSIGINLAVTVALSFAAGWWAGRAARAAEGATKAATSAEGVLTAEQASAASKIQAQVAGEATGTAEAAEGATGKVSSVNVPIAAETKVLEPEAINSEVGTTGLKEIADPSTMKMGGWMPRFTFKMWTMFVGQFAGQVWSEMSNIDMLRAYGQDPDQMPGLRDFTDKCVSPAVWPQTTGVTLACAGLNGAFTLGLKVD